MLLSDMTGVLIVLEGLLLSLAVGALCRRAPAIGRILGVFDHPDASRKFHPAPTPLVGGLSTVLPMTGVALVEAYRQPAAAPLLLLLAACGAAFLLLGYCDDRRHVSASTRLLVSTLVLTAVLAVEPALVVSRLTFAADPAYSLDLGLLAAPFTLLCLIGFQNAVNMADGANGLVIGLSIGWLALLLPYAPAELRVFVPLFMVALAVALPFNLSGRLFLGDSGAYAVSVLTGLLIVYTYNRSGALLALSVMLWLMVPVVDCLRVMALRLAAGRSPFAPDRLHLHHRLMAALPWPLAIAAYLGLAILPGLTAELLPAAGALLVFSTLCVYGLILRVCRAAPA